MIRSFCGLVFFGLALSFISGCGGSPNQSDAKMEGEPPKGKSSANFAPPPE